MSSQSSMRLTSLPIHTKQIQNTSWAAPSSTFALIKPPNSYPTHQILQTFPNISKPRQPCPFLSHPSKSRQTHFLSKFDSTSILDLPFPTIPDPPDPEIHNFPQQDINRNPHPGHPKPIQGCIFCPTLDHA